MADRPPSFLSDARAMTGLLFRPAFGPFGSFWRGSEVTVATIFPPNRRDGNGPNLDN
jgi:hypothetical protein